MLHKDKTIPGPRDGKREEKNGVRAKKNAKLPTIGQDDSFITSLSHSHSLFLCVYIDMSNAGTPFIYIFIW